MWNTPPESHTLSRGSFSRKEDTFPEPAERQGEPATLTCGAESPQLREAGASELGHRRDRARRPGPARLLSLATVQGGWASGRVFLVLSETQTDGATPHKARLTPSPGKRLPYQ